jgi:hypothetical protein
VCLACSIARNRGFSNRYRKTTNFGHYVKRDKEVEEKRAYFRFSTYRCPLGFAADFDIIGVKCVEDLKILFEALGDFGPDDSCV